MVVVMVREKGWDQEGANKELTVGKTLEIEIQGVGKIERHRKNARGR